MSSSYIVEPQESDSKKDDTLIIVVNDDGTIAVDQETLQNLIMNQSNANVSVVRVGQTEDDAENGNLTFTVDPPAYVTPESSPRNTASGATDTGLVDPFMEMDAEQLEKLETALQSEQAKQILGENVAAMLDMLTVEEEQNSIRYAIELDHCYTSRLSPLDPEPPDPLPVANSPDIDQNDLNSGLLNQPKVEMTRVAVPVVKPAVKVKQPVGRPRKSTISSVQSLTGAQKSPGTANVKSSNTTQSDTRKSISKEEENNVDPLSSSSESSESAASDNDSDFGPRGPRRAGVRARGGRRGLTTRGGSMAASRRRGSSRRMDVDQVRRLDIEMAAAVNAMKNPDQLDKMDKLSVNLGKKQLKTISSRKRDDLSPIKSPMITESSTSPPPPTPPPPPLVVEKPLQTTNQVKANLINANMIKGDMILTKPGQGRSNQKVFFVQKKVVVKPNEIKTLGAKQNTLVFTKDSVKSTNQIQTKLSTSEDGKLISVSSKPQTTQSPLQEVSAETAVAAVVTTTATTTSVISTSTTTTVQSPPQSLQKQILKLTSPPALVKIRSTPEVKKEKKKIESNDTNSKVEESAKPMVDTKIPDLSKKHVKKEQRKPPGHVADALGPALFSTPDIIRRVGSGADSKPSDSNITSGNIMSDASVSETSTSSSSITPTVIPSLKTDYSSLGPDMQPETANLLAESESSIEDYTDEQTSKVLNNDEEKNDSKLSVIDDLQTSLDPASNPTSTEEIARPSGDSVVSNMISDQSEIEGEEHLLATLEMEASKHEEELLAEALLLQEQLDVDLSDPSALDGPTSSISEPLLSPSSFDNSMLPVTNTDLSNSKTGETQSAASSPLSSSNSDVAKRKDSKEPIQIVRGGRVITLPPIEAPATRSKRLQVRPESVHKTVETPKKDDKVQKPVLLQQLKQLDEMESDLDDEDDEEENSDSEDDPNRLWCICKRPHNNRFMICCDVCEDWFHGKCVHVSKSMGQQMEEQGIEWVCPNCAKKKVDSPGIKVNKMLSAKSTKVSVSPSQRLLTEVLTPPSSQTSDKSVKSTADTMPVGQPMNPVMTQCVVCKKEARNSSIYCSDACILVHAQETLTKDKPTPQTKVVKAPGDPTKPSPDARVIVFERKTGKVLTGADAPTTSNLKTWLKEHPTFEVVRSSNLNTLQIGGKMVTAIHTQGSGKIIKSSQQSIQPGQAKMVYTKVVGSKQTILASSSKKMTVISNLQGANMLSKSPGQVKHAVLISSNKTPTILKQMTIKTVPQQVKSSTPPKPVLVKKHEPKPSSFLTNQKLPQKSPTVKKSEPEPIRLNVRKTLAELLTTRIKETSDLKLTEEEISDLALNIELELYKYFRDTGAKYKAKYRSLVFNIKDTKNLTLFRKIADRSLTPDAVVRLSPEEMASQELAEWREKETKHQLEMIKKNELDLMAQAKSIVVKTHKGEQIIENDGGIDAVDPKTPVQDIVTALNNADNVSSDILDEKEESTMSSLEDAKKTKRSDEKKKKDKDRDRDRDSHKSRKKERNKDSKRDKSTSRNRSHRSRDRRRNKDDKRDKEKDRSKEKDRDKTKDKEKQKEKDRSRHSSKTTSTIHGKSSSHKENKDKEKKRNEIEDESKREDEKKKEPSPVPAEKSIEDRLWRHIEDETTTNTLDGNDSDISDREPSSTVNIKTPDINEESEKEKEIVPEPEPISQIKEQKGQMQTVWRGFVNMVDVAKFFITAQELSGNSKELTEDLPDTVDVVGRISHETVWDYISKMKKTGSKEILVIRLTAANDEEKIPYITLYSYLNSRSRLGVVGNVSKNIKDFYIMPFSSQSQIPPVLLPMNGPGFEENRPHLLLGIIVRNKRKRLAHPLPNPTPIPAKQSRKDTAERSYTPPLIQSTKDKLSNSIDKVAQQESLSEKSVVTQLTLNTLNKAHVGMSRTHIDSVTISKIVPELSSKIDLTSSPEKAPPEQNDDDEPYSPGDIEEDAEDSLAKLTAANLLAPAKNSTELQRKIDELNRQIEEQKQQIQTISSSFLGETVPILPGLGEDPPDTNEAYSPTDIRSFTPPPPSTIPKFTQPILDKVSDITIPSNLQEILANVKRQESSKVDSYLPSKPSASFLTSMSAPVYQKSEKSTYSSPAPPVKETKSTLRSLSDLDLIKKAEEELAAVAAASMAVVAPTPPIPEPLPPRELLDPISADIFTPPIESLEMNYSKSIIDTTTKSRASDQPRPPGVEDEDFVTFPSTPPPNVGSRSPRSSQKFVPKSGVVLSVKRKMSDDNGSESSLTPKTTRTKSRWGQGPSD